MCNPYINPWVVVKVNLLLMLGFLSASTVLGSGRYGQHNMITTRVSPFLAKELLIWPDLWLNIILHKTAPLGQSVGTFVPYMLPIGTFVP